MDDMATTNNAVFTEIDAMKPWFHNLHLPNGQQTAPDHFLGDFPDFKWQQLQPHIPRDLHGWSVLDIGCNAGFYTFELAKRGAYVTGIDLDPHYLRQAEWASEVYGLQDQVEFRQQQVYDLAKSDEKFDMIWFMGVLYHLRYPLLALDIVCSKVKKMLVFQTLTMPGEDMLETKGDYAINERDEMLSNGWPKMAFIEHRLAGDPTNWWAPNKAGLHAMLRTCGMKVTSAPMHETLICAPDPAKLPVVKDWNESEYLSAIGEDWQAVFNKKVKK